MFPIPATAVLWKYGLIALGFIAYTGGVYYVGRLHERQEYTLEQVELAKEETRRVEEEASQRIGVAEQAERRSQEIARNVEKGLERLEQVVREGPVECDLTDEEVAAFEQIGSS